MVRSDLSDLEDAVRKELAGSIREAVQAAYARGYNDARRAILEATNIPELERAPAPAQTPDSGGSTESGQPKRAPRGLVPSVIQKVLREMPGTELADLEKIVPEKDDRIAVRSVGNELRRREGTAYERDEPGGTKWYLLGDKPQSRAAEDFLGLNE